MKDIVLIFCLALSIVACVRRGPLAESHEIIFGEYGPMTGSESTFGVETHKGIELAVDETNLSGGIKGKKIRLVTYDDEGKTDVAVVTMTRLVTQDRALVVLGESVSSRSMAAGIVAQKH